ncbi:MAG TPA: hypothetical protein VKC54_03130 [Patescibacteria group bacterium]|nr:hypothetical protein [Patescibacteria group bacterium]
MTGIAAFNGKNLVSAKAGVSKALKKNYIVSDFSLQFKLPNILSVQVLAKKPVFALYNTATNQSALIGPEGETLSISSGTSLPRLFINQNLPKPGERVSANYLFALKLIGGVFEMYQVGEGDLQSGSLTVDLPGPIKVIFPLEGDRDVILGALKLIYAKTQGEGSRKFSQIDLRYKNPVLR